MKMGIYIYVYVVKNIFSQYSNLNKFLNSNPVMAGHLGVFGRSTGHVNIRIWVVVKIMVPFWIPIIIRHLMFRTHEKGS